MNTLIKVTLVTLLLSVSTLYGESTHSHSHDSHGHSHAEHSNLDKKLSSAEIQNIAQKEVEKLITEKKIPKSWKSIPISKVGKDQSGYSNDWIVVFENAKIKKESKQTLYIFVDTYGDVTGANYTGK